MKITKYTDKYIRKFTQTKDVGIGVISPLEELQICRMICTGKIQKYALGGIFYCP